MAPYDAMGCPTMKFKYGNDCLCENQVECRGLTAAFSCLGNDPRSGFVRLPNYKENPSSQYYVERNLQREAYLRYLLPNHPPSEATLAKDVALHHFHPRVVARLVSKLQKNIPRTVPEEEMAQLGMTVDERDKLLDEEGKPTGRCIFAPSYPMDKAKEDLKRLLRLCRALNAKSKDDKDKASKDQSPSRKKIKKRRFDPDIRQDDDFPTRGVGKDEDATLSAEVEPDSLASANIQSLLVTYMRLEPIPEDQEPPELVQESTELKVDSPITLDTEFESESDDDDEEESTPQNSATVSMQIHLAKLHSGKGKNRMSKMMNRKPNPFYEISVLREKDSVMTRETIYRSYPLTDTKDATWDPIVSLDLGVDVNTPADSSFRITVFDCDMKTGKNHLLIGTSDVNTLDLLTTPNMSISIRRDDKIKGFLTVSGFQFHTTRNGVGLLSRIYGSTRDLVTNFSADAEDSDEESQEVIDSNSVEESAPASQEAANSNGTVEKSTVPRQESVAVEESEKNVFFVSTVCLETSADQESSLESNEVESAVLSTPILSMQISLEDLLSAKGKKRMSKVTNKAPNPFYEISVLHTNKNSTTWWETLMRSYPLTGARSGTWDAIEGLDLGVEVRSPEDLVFRITVYDCDIKGGKHLFIGASEVKASDLIKAPSTPIPLQRGDKVKGSLRFLKFQLE